MTKEEFIQQILQAFGWQPTTDQRHALDVFAQFLTDRREQTVMILRGSAGTGKTSLAAAMVRTLRRLGQKMLLLAPTGRAAKVFSLNAGEPAYTIHRKIYRQKTFAGDFNLNDNLHADTLFVIDEASMIANGQEWGAERKDVNFGSGGLLDDLVKYIYSGRNCRMLLIGDKAQLPPVGDDHSPALDVGMMAGYGLSSYECDLNEVLRQSHESGILYNATVIRNMLTSMSTGEATLPTIRLHGFADIQCVPGNELIEQLNSSYSRVGMDETMVITRSNKRANIYNQGIRNTILDREEELCTGDLIMIVKNNYKISTPDTNTTKEEERPFTFIANGDRALVQRVRNVRELYGFRFADVWLQYPDYGNYEMQSTVVMESLTTEAPALTHEQSNRLYEAIMEDYAYIPRKPDRIARLKEDPYYNALQVKFAYAVTCHKAQGGQWAHVYIDQGYMTDDMLTPDYVHWLYTAFTRATEKLYLVNWPRTQTEETEEE